jgi:hypothetical protein
MELVDRVLTIIFAHLDIPDLRAVFGTSKRWHAVATPILLHRLGVRDGTGAALSPSHDNMSLSVKGLAALRVLQIATLFLDKDLDKLEFSFSYSAMMEEIRYLVQFLVQLGHVDKVFLDFGHMRSDQLIQAFDPLRPSKKTLAISMLIANLLAAIRTKRCTSITFKEALESGGTTMSRPPSTLAEYASKTNMASTLSSSRRQTILEAVTNKASRRASALNILVKNRVQTEPEIRPSGFSDALPTIEPCDTLESLSVHSSVALYPPFFNWIMDTILASSITTLSLRFTVPTQSWERFLPSIALPSLKRLIVVTPSFIIASLGIFLYRHSTISSLTLHSAVLAYHPTTPHTLPPKFLPNIITLEGTPDYVTHLIVSACEPLKTLQSIAIALPMGMPKTGNTYFDVLNGALRVMSTRSPTSASSLTINFPGGYQPADWLKGTRPAAAADIVLPSFTQLTLRTHGALGSLSMSLAFLIRWFQRFPGINHVIFEDVMATSTASHYQYTQLRCALAYYCSRACKGLQTAQVLGEERHIADWIAEFDDGWMTEDGTVVDECSDA